MKKAIRIHQLRVGMYIAGAVKENIKGVSKKSVLLLGSGMQVTSENQIRRLKESGLDQVTIDTERGIDVSGDTHVGQIAPPRPHRERRTKRLPPGRQVPYREELKQARKTREVVAKAFTGMLADIARRGDVDRTRIGLAGKLMADSVFRNVDAMVGLTRIKEHDPYTATHCVNVCVLVLAMVHADGIDRSTAEMIASGALLHDIGKTRVPLEILTKPGRYEPHELAEMRKHSLYGEKILRVMPGITDEVFYIVAHHHEMLDGSGYPRRLLGDDIHRFAQITAVADVYDALTTARTYRSAMLPHFALRHIYGNRNKVFRQDVVNLFVKSLGIYPVGSLVLLNTGEVGIVCEPNPEDSQHPKVGIIVTRYKNRRPTPLVVDLAGGNPTEKRKIVKVLDHLKYDLDVERLLKASTG